MKPTLLHHDAPYRLTPERKRKILRKKSNIARIMRKIVRAGRVVSSLNYDRVYPMGGAAVTCHKLTTGGFQ